MTLEEIEKQLAELDRAENPILVKNFNPEDAIKDIDAQLAALDQTEQALSQPGMLERIGSAIDAYTGAPTRAAIGAIATGQGLGGAVSKFGEQFGADPSLAPTGKEIAEVAGLSTEPLIQTSRPIPVEGPQGRIITTPQGQPLMQEAALPSPAGAAGLAIDVLADYSNFIPVGAVIGGVAKGTKGAVKSVLKGSLAAADMATGKNVTEAAQQTSRILDNAAQAVKRRFKPEVAEDFTRFSEIAKKNGIDPSILPETVEFGPQSTVTLKAKTIAEGPGGEAIQKRFQKAEQAISEALDTKLKTIAGGEKLSRVEAGEMLINAYNDGIKKFFDQDFITHDRIMKNAPGLNLTQDSLGKVNKRLNEMSRYAKGRLQRGFGDQPGQAAQILKDVETLRRSFDKQGNLSYKRATEALRNIGEEAFKKVPAGAEKLPIDRSKLRELYFDLRDAMIDTVDFNQGAEIGQELRKANELISDFLDEKSVVNKIFEGDLAPEKVVSRLVDSGDSKKVEALRAILPAEDFNKFKGVLVNESLIKNADGDILFPSSIKKLSSRESLLSKALDPQEAQDLTELLELGNRTGSFRFNMSNTDRARRFSDFFNELGASIVDESTLEQVKNAARKRSAIEFTAQESRQLSQLAKTNPKQAQSAFVEIVSKKAGLPMFQSKGRMTLKAGALQGTQRTNEQLEREKRQRAVNERR